MIGNGHRQLPSFKKRPVEPVTPPGPDEFIPLNNESSPEPPAEISDKQDPEARARALKAYHAKITKNRARQKAKNAKILHTTAQSGSGAINRLPYHLDRAAQLNTRLNAAGINAEAHLSKKKKFMALFNTLKSSHIDEMARKEATNLRRAMRQEEYITSAIAYEQRRDEERGTMVGRIVSVPTALAFYTSNEQIKNSFGLYRTVEIERLTPVERENVYKPILNAYEKYKADQELYNTISDQLDDILSTAGSDYPDQTSTARQSPTQAPGAPAAIPGNLDVMLSDSLSMDDGSDIYDITNNL
ncbi:hypothetical protein BCR33DRAFT_856146 [Rhizoclosmatium globosum]|uniref:Uncharacterized protein n=1 Tax=Rhizoclosmatium globosum TaxID=329046 RepID=A0A1Y2BGM3_9FUNG|nr:hypothetical protein BCR33DRAFT_856146 [Rhizoclosmatium globosum]|eukprot:ORY33876.1 hypothetical protein BCR33DRAFT_856146 [Rhizoclosmatium globosum]